MNAKRILFFLILAGYIFIAGCNKNDSNNNGKLISLTIPADYYSYYDYVNYFTNTPDGDLIYSQQINNEEEVLFEVNQGNNINRFDLSRCVIKDYGTYIGITITSFIELLPFSLEFHTTSSTYLGYAYITFTDVPAYTSYLLANSASNITTETGDLSTTSFNIPLYSNLPKGLLIKLNTGTSELYKFVDNLVVGQTTNVSLAAMNSDFSSANISLNTTAYNNLSLTVDRYSENDFSSGSYSIIKTLISPPISFTYPASFLQNNYTRTYLHCTVGTKYTSSNVYSADIPNSVELLDGTGSFYGNLPESISCNFDLNDQIDAMSFSCYHSSTFINAHGFRVTWNIWISPSSTDFTLPEIPEEIFNYLSDNYLIDNLQFASMESVSANLYQYGRSQDFDEFMEYYWLGWPDPEINETDKFLNIYFSGKKNDYVTDKSFKLPEQNNSNQDY
jgi:hypothetical protein